MVLSRARSTLLLLFFACAPAFAQTAQPLPRPSVSSALVLAATAGSRDEVERLIAEGASPNMVNLEKTPVLSLAARRRDEAGAEVVKALLAAGANPQAVDAMGETPMFYAAREGAEGTARLLLEAGVDYNATNPRGLTPRAAALAERQDAWIATLDTLSASAAAARARAEAANRAANPPKPVAKLDKEALQAQLQALSLHACYASYWTFLREVRMETGLNLKEEIAKETHAAFEAEEILRRGFHATDQYIRNVRGPTEKKILAQLNAFPTNAHRKQENIGTREDAATRCETIAESWKLQDERKKRPKQRP